MIPNQVQAATRAQTQQPFKELGGHTRIDARRGGQCTFGQCAEPRAGEDAVFTEHSPCFHPVISPDQPCSASQ
ncbi:hypothetical protein SL103_07460 [Streptomyces lydicus]|uniref:Uncharacterized protein n=1 Tax=Streptomyces lydicus TaxID=47763 RepID=A0A1D7VH96_9ACTN|nr:hypothetical protein SL103_07460 [Streptomyces lydicus]